MAHSNTVDDIIEFLRRNKFMKAEAALRTELGTPPSSNGILRKLSSDEASCCKSAEEVNRAKESEGDKHTINPRNSDKDLNAPKASRELIVREVECGTVGNGSGSNWKTRDTTGEQRMVDVSVGTSDFTFFERSGDTVLDLYSTKYSTSDGLVCSLVSGGAMLNVDKARESSKDNAKPPEDGEVIMSWPVSSNNVFIPSSSEHWKDCLVETFVPVPGSGASTSGDSAAVVDKREGRREKEMAGISAEMKGQVDDMGRAVYLGDVLSESAGFRSGFWDSDEYEDYDDVGYTRQPIEDETWFLAHEINYPSDNDKGTTGHGSFLDAQERERNKNDKDDQSLTEGDSYFSGEQYLQSINVDRNPGGLCEAEIYCSNNGRLMDEEELNLICSEPAWLDFLAQTDELMLGTRKVIVECRRPHMEDPGLDIDQHGSVRSIGVGINSDVADVGVK